MSISIRKAIEVRRSHCVNYHQSVYTLTRCGLMKRPCLKYALPCDAGKSGVTLRNFPEFPRTSWPLVCRSLPRIWRFVVQRDDTEDILVTFLVPSAPALPERLPGKHDGLLLPVGGTHKITGKPADDHYAKLTSNVPKTK